MIQWSGRDRYIVSAIKTLFYTPSITLHLPRLIQSLLTLLLACTPTPLLSLRFLNGLPRELAILPSIFLYTFPYPHLTLLLPALLPPLVILLAPAPPDTDTWLEMIWWGFPAVLVAGGWMIEVERKEVRGRIGKMEELKYNLKGA